MLFLKFRYVGDTLGKENILNVIFSILNKLVPIELVRYVENYVVESSIGKFSYNAWDIKVLKIHTRDVKFL